MCLYVCMYVCTVCIIHVWVYWVDGNKFMYNTCTVCMYMYVYVYMYTICMYVCIRIEYFNVKRSLITCRFYSRYFIYTVCMYTSSLYLAAPPYLTSIFPSSHACMYVCMCVCAMPGRTQPRELFYANLKILQLRV